MRSASLLVLVSLFSAARIWGQTLFQKAVSNEPQAPQAAQPSPVPEVPRDALGHDTPYSTVVGFLKAAEQGDWERAAQFVDSKQPPAQKQELARQLKLVMDKGLALDLGTLSKSPEGAPKEDVRRTHNEVGSARIGNRSLPARQWFYLEIAPSLNWQCGLKPRWD